MSESGQQGSTIAIGSSRDREGRERESKCNEYK